MIPTMDEQIAWCEGVHKTYAMLGDDSADVTLTAILATLREAKAREVQQPVAWRTFDGEGGYDLRNYEDNENYADDWAKQNPHHVGWVQPLYAAPVAPEGWVMVPKKATPTMLVAGANVDPPTAVGEVILRWNAMLAAAQEPKPEEPKS